MRGSFFRDNQLQITENSCKHEYLYFTKNRIDYVKNVQYGVCFSHFNMNMDTYYFLKQFTLMMSIIISESGFPFFFFT